MNEPSVCLANIGPRERRRRVSVGVASLVVGALVVALLTAFPVSRAWRLLAFLPLWVGALGIFQAQQRTCVALVARGQKNMDEGPQTITNQAELQQLKAQARAVHLRALALAVFLSAVALSVP